MHKTNAMLLVHVEGRGWFSLDRNENKFENAHICRNEANDEYKIVVRNPHKV